MDYVKESLKKHAEWGGKIEVIAKVPCKTKDDLSIPPALHSPVWRFRRISTSLMS